METEWQRVRDLLYSEKVVKKKEGIKEIHLLLDSDEFLKAMDVWTLRIWPHDPISAASWPGLCSDLTKFITQQIANDLEKKRGPDQSLGKLLKRTIRLADDKTRPSGGRLMLMRRVRRLFDHVAKVLSVNELSTQLVSDYTSILHFHLLPISEYCSEAAATTFEELLDIELRIVEGLSEDNFERAYDNLLAIKLLVQNFPGDIPQVLQRDLMFFFTEQAQHLHQVRDAPKAAIAYFACLKSFLSGYGLNHLGQVSQLHRALHGFVRSSVFLHQSSKLKDIVVDYLRIQLQLGGIQGVENALLELYDICEEYLCQSRDAREEISTPGWSWGASRTRGKVDRVWYSRNALVASIVFHAEQLETQEELGMEESRRKRRKRSRVQERMSNNIEINPRLWGPIFCTLLHQHGDCLSSQFIQWCLAEIAKYSDRLATNLIDLKEEKNLPGVVWVLRSAFVLSSFWDSSFCEPGCGEEWKKIAQAALKVSDQDKRLQIEVISLYSVMLSRGLLSLVSVGSPDYFLAAIYSRPVLGAVLWLLPLMACGGLANSQDYQALAECFVEGIVDLNDPGVIAKVLGQLMNVQACQAYLDCHQTKGAWKSWFALDSGQLMFEKQLRSMQRGRVHFRSMAFTSRVSHSSSVHEDAERSDGSILHIAILSEILRMLKSLPVDVEGLESCKRLLRVCLAAALVLVWMPQKNRHDVTTRVLEDIEDELDRKISFTGLSLGSWKSSDETAAGELLDLVNRLVLSAVELEAQGKCRICKSMMGWITCIGDSFVVRYEDAFAINSNKSDSLKTSKGLFDVELDLNMSSKGQSTNNGPLIGSDISRDHLCFCLDLLTVLGGVCKKTTRTILQRITEHMNMFEASPPDHVRCALIRSASVVGAMCKGDALLEACEALKAEMDLSPAARCPNSRVEFILDCLQSMIVCQSPDPLPFGPSLCHLYSCVDNVDRETWKSLVEVFDGLVALMRSAPNLETTCHKGSARLKFAELAMGFAHREPSKYGVDIEDFVLAVMRDPHPDFVLRRKSIPLICHHLRGWKGSRAYFDGLQFSVLQRPSTDSIRGNLGQGPQGILESEIEFLATCAVECSELENDCLYVLLSHAVLAKGNMALIENAVDWISTSMGYLSRCEYLVLHCQRLVSMWFSKGRTLEEFLSLCGLLGNHTSDHQTELAILPAEYLVPVATLLVTVGEGDSVAILADAIGKSKKSLVADCLTQLLATLKISIVCGTSGAKQSAENVFQKGILSEVVAGSKISAHAHGRSLEIIEALLLMTTDSKSPSPGCYPVRRIVQTIRSVMDAREDDFEPKGPQACWLILQIHKWISRAKNPRHKMCPLSALTALMEVLSDHIHEDIVFRYTVHVLLILLRTAQLQGTVCSLIRQAFERKMRAAKSDVEHWRQLRCSMQHVASRVTEYVEKPEGSTGRQLGWLPSANLNVYLTSKSTTNIENLISLLNLLVSHEELKRALCDLEPFPSAQVFSVVRKAHATVHKGTSLDNQISLFVKRNNLLTVSMKERSISHLRKLLDESRMEIYRMACKRSASKYLVRSTWKLLPLIEQESACKDMCTLCGELLGLIGPFDPYIITLRSICSPQSHSWIRPIASLQGSSAEQSISSVESMLVHVIRFLSAALLDDDVHAAECAQITLAKLLKSSGHQTIHQIAQLGQQYKSLFAAYANTDLCSLDMVARIRRRWRTKRSLEDDDVWHVTNSSYGVWVCRLGQVLIESSDNVLLEDCQGMVSMRTSFAELMMPFILHDLAVAGRDNSSIKQALSHQISKFILPRAGDCKKAAQLVLSCTEFLRHSHLDRAAHAQPNRSKSDGLPINWSTVYWLDLDYLSMSRLACQCCAFFTALVYIEQWCETKNCALTLPEVGIDDLDQSSLPLVDELLLNIHKSIDDVDGLCAVARTPHWICRLTKCDQKCDWQQALTLQDLAISQNIERTPTEKQNLHLGLAKSLQHLGWTSLLRNRLSVLKETSIWDDEFYEIESELSWRLGDWGASETHRPEPTKDTSIGFNSALHNALCSLKEGNQRAFLEDVARCRSDVVKKMASSAAESLSTVNPALARLQMVDMMCEAWCLKWPAKGADAQESQEVLSLASKFPDADGRLNGVESIWNTRESLAGSEGRFELMEPLLALHGVLLKCIGLRDRLPDVFLRTIIHARKAGNLSASWRALEHLKNFALLEKESECPFLSRLAGPDALWRLEEAQLLWLSGEKTMAVQLGKSIIQKLKTHPNRFDNDILAEWLCALATWQADTKAVPSSCVMKMLTEATQAVSNQEHDVSMWSGPVACRILFRLATFADARYQAIHAQRSSREWLMSKAVMEKKKMQIADLHEQLKNTSNPQVKSALMGNIEKLQRPVRTDEQQARALEEDESRFLSIALVNFRRCLMADNQHDLSVVFRLCQLWFRLAPDAEVNEKISEAFDEVPSYKFVPLVYQIASRMSASRSDPLYSSGFQPALHRLISRLAMDHPYHVLCQLLALRNGNLGSDGKVESGPISIVMSRDIDLDKVEAAGQLLSYLSTQPKIGEIVGQMSTIVNAYISLAAAKAPSTKVVSVAFPKSIRLSVQDLHLIPILSKSMEVQRDGAYKFKHFRAFGLNIRFVGGINKPKLIACEDSDGKKHRELVKSGSDDLRQDAVMQQFFQLVNSLLRDCSDTRKRKLSIVPYKVVPFSPGAGMLEWVEYTIPMSNYLLGADKKGGAHVRYRGRSDLSFAQCYQRLGRVTNAVHARKEFDAICKHYHPVFHHFFLERFQDPAIWFEKRLAYTRSTAVNSMAGYIIGLGDRHSSNILVKTNTAEVVHIDLGIAFEQGRFLTVPELVPFRLTRDIVDGMGINGVEGTMRRCCEEVIKVMRLNKEALLTIVEVFIHDPLYKWGMTPIKARRRQREDSSADLILDNSSVVSDDGLPTVGNADAERALLRVQKKIDGTEEGEPRGVEGQVQQLLQDAQNPDNLASMFVGWAPWV